jgi:hypothetical protein
VHDATHTNGTATVRASGAGTDELEASAAYTVSANSTATVEVSRGGELGIRRSRLGELAQPNKNRICEHEADENASEESGPENDGWGRSAHEIWLTNHWSLPLVRRTSEALS